MVLRHERAVQLHVVAACCRHRRHVPGVEDRELACRYEEPPHFRRIAAIGDRRRQGHVVAVKNSGRVPPPAGQPKAAVGALGRPARHDLPGRHGVAGLAAPHLVLSLHRVMAELEIVVDEEPHGPSGGHAAASQLAENLRNVFEVNLMAAIALRHDGPEQVGPLEVSDGLFRDSARLLGRALTLPKRRDHVGDPMDEFVARHPGFRIVEGIHVCLSRAGHSFLWAPTPSMNCSSAS